MQCPLESSDVSRAQPQFTRSLDDEQSVGELGLHQPMNDGCGAVRTAVIDDQDVKTLIQREDGTDDFLHVLFLIVRRNDDDAVGFVHSFIILWVQDVVKNECEPNVIKLAWNC